VTTDARPGPAFRVTAAGGAAATALVVSSGASGLERAHNVLALVALAFLTALFLCAWFAYRRLAVSTGAALALMIAEIGLGGVAWAAGDGAWLHAAHVALAGAALAAAMIAAAAAFRGERVPAGPLGDYLTLTKPRIMTLLLLTGAGGMFVGARGTPSPTGVAVMLLGLALACGGASALNHVLDRDIDSHMRRTDRRPVAAGRVPPARALEFGLALSALSFALLASAANVLTALLALAGNLFYVLVYTRWLKRSTPQNIVIGGAAGAIPPLVGWAAATGNLTVPALALFLVVFFWTPPHFWALALLIKRDYAAARIPMLPVVRGDDETARQILLYSLALVPITLLPVALGTLGAVYLGSALLLGGTLVVLAWQLRHDPAPARARSLFHYSLAYLALLFVAMSVDPLLHVGVA
jgi:protoheme IX farnesyltransferase